MLRWKFVVLDIAEVDDPDIGSAVGYGELHLLPCCVSSAKAWLVRRLCHMGL